MTSDAAVRCKANLHDIFLKIFHGFYPMFHCAVPGLKMNELVLFTNIFVQLVSSLLGSFFFIFPSRQLSITLFISI